MRFFPVFVINVFYTVNAESPAALIQKECGILWEKFMADRQIMVQLLADNGGGDKKKTLFFPFSVYQNGAVLADIIFDIQGGNLPDAESQAEEQLDDTHIPNRQAALIIGKIVVQFVGRTGEQCPDFLARQCFRECMRYLKTAGGEAEETLAVSMKTAQVVAVLPDGYVFPADGARREFDFVLKIYKVRQKRLLVQRRVMAHGKPLQKGGHVTPVGVQRIFA